MAVIIAIFFSNDKKLSSHMAQISEHISFSYHKMYSYDQMRKIIVNLVSNKCENRNNSTCQLTRLRNSLFMIIVDTPEKY